MSPNLFFVSTSKGRIVRVVRDTNLGQISSEPFVSTSSTSFLGLSSIFGGGTSSIKTSTSTPIRKLLVADKKKSCKHLLVLRETGCLECYDTMTSNLKWKMDSVQCVTTSETCLYILNTSGVLSSVTNGDTHTIKRLTRIFDEKEKNKSSSLHMTSDAIFVILEEENQNMLISIFDLKCNTLISLSHLIRGGLGSGSCRDSLCVLDDEDDVVLCVERKQRDEVEEEDREEEETKTHQAYVLF